ncbi:hypothetical protein LXM94_14585 [Rhizobium sp. TRM95111]|uniref:hypothetical protein n=1 Tax=Rhizobium alarense TaxID=2846851 RepID=UPI001F29AE2B|nr:hypothetical protein [Rhizobium alarense]MCF3641200.1 hypothetical protein [Rhizobium alarense]
MLYEWIVLFEALNRKPPAGRRDPLADPLSRPEWQGLGWFNRLVAAAGRGRGPKRPAKEPATPSTRPACAAAGAKGAA